MRTEKAIFILMDIANITNNDMLSYGFLLFLLVGIKSLLKKKQKIERKFDGNNKCSAMYL